jgi:hypothetical protein
VTVTHYTHAMGARMPLFTWCWPACLRNAHGSGVAWWRWVSEHSLEDIAPAIRKQFSVRAGDLHLTTPVIRPQEVTQDWRGVTCLMCLGSRKD